MGRTGWIVLSAGIFMLIIAMGIRQSFGIFVPVLSMELDVGRQSISLALALQNLLWGVAQPVTGYFADRWGAVRMGVIGGILYAGALILAQAWGSPLGLQMTIGIMVGVALAGTTYGTVLGAVGKAVPAEKRTMAFGICTAAGSFGMFAVVPGAQALLDILGWSMAFTVMAAAAVLMVPLSFGLGLKSAPVAVGAVADAGMGPTVRAARKSGSYWLLNAGFFVCGFHVAFVAAHLPAFLRDQGMATSVTAWSLAMIGLFNIFGSYLMGVLGQRYSPRILLSILYLARGVVIVLFIALPVTPLTAIAFGAGIGFLWLGTVPLTSGIVARMFGVRYMSMLYGFVFMFHQIGAFIGVWGAGWAYDLLGSYDIIWWSSIALAIFAGIVHLPIRDQAVAIERRAVA
ncbi:MFS transporter [Lacibacterium aquatile]|uniref:MFS transporter n=1 Tax=Lacibacterium aquatile TaxID=1168082 RepID=A0ABW5DMH8_9PROT